jgi:N-acetylgalactosamine kinase
MVETSRDHSQGSGNDRLMSAAAWREGLRSRPAAARETLARIYGEQPALLASRQAMLADLLDLFIASFGDTQPVVVARAPGRVNLMGRHIDHRGGYCNTIAIPNDVWVVAAARDDGRLCLRNLDPEFAGRDLDPADLARAADEQSWHDFIESETVGSFLAGNRGAWTNYPLGAYLRFRREFGGRVAGGLSAAFWGDVPRSVGLSSSSALFVATALGLVRLGGVEIKPDHLVDLCGQGEWFVGTRGGAGDHAAMIFGQRGMLSQIGFFPIHLGERATLPREIEIILCNSCQRAQKSREARDRFNARVAAYAIGLAVLRQRWPTLTAHVKHLRDVNPVTLEVGVDRIYEALKTIPLWMTRDEVACALPEQIEEIETWFATHGDHEGGYPLRAVLLFGIAECERSRQALEVIGSGDGERIRRLFAISHDGDRVTRCNSDGHREAWKADVGDDYLDRLIGLSRSSDPADRERAALAGQPGAYGCSTPEIDEMVDIANVVEGVAGAQLVGAGLGGSIVVLGYRGASEGVRRALEEKYYAPRGWTPDVHVFQPAEGGGCLTPET